MKKRMTKSQVSQPPRSSEGLNSLSIMYIDGASRGNPGASGAGVIIKDPSGKTIRCKRQYLGIGTNNRAEYLALLIGLEAAIDAGIKRLRICSDSELLVKQLRGEYRVKNPELKKLYEKALILIKNFDKINIEHIPREMNRDADTLANEAIDARR